jgi:hypothetical protein
MTAVSKLADFLALRRNTTLLLGALLLSGTGEKPWLGFAPKYLETLVAGVFIIGSFLFLAWSALSLSTTVAVVATSLHLRVRPDRLPQSPG